jgi:hypothetical protein
MPSPLRRTGICRARRHSVRGEWGVENFAKSGNVIEIMDVSINLGGVGGSPISSGAGNVAPDMLQEHVVVCVAEDVAGGEHGGGVGRDADSLVAVIENRTSGDDGGGSIVGIDSMSSVVGNGAMGDRGGGRVVTVDTVSLVVEDDAMGNGGDRHPGTIDIDAGITIIEDAAVGDSGRGTAVGSLFETVQWVMVGEEEESSDKMP